MPVNVTIRKRYIAPAYYQAPVVPSSQNQQRHFETGRFRSETSYTVIVTFNTPFQSKPIGINNLKVYKMFQLAAGKWGMSDVLFTFPSEEDWLTNTGFTINIDPIENLVGIWIEYCFTE